jgi:hypothetical protein
MSKLTAVEFQEKHARRLKAASSDIRAGIEKVSVSPTSLAAKKIDKMRTNLLAKIDDGTVARRLNAVTLEEWKSKAVNIGVGRIAQGIDGAAAKVVSFAEKLLPAIDAAQSKVRAMPDLTLEDNINRMTTMVREMSKFRK